MSDYTKTTWVSGGVPALDAPALNNMEDGIDTAHEEIATNEVEYDAHVAGTADKHAHADLSDAPTSAHHVKYTDADAVAAIEADGTIRNVISFVLAGTATTGPIPFRFKAMFPFTMVAQVMTADTAPVGGTPSLRGDIHLNGTTINTTQSNRPEIASGVNSGSESTPDVTVVVAGDILTGEIDDVGLTTAGANVIIELEITVP